MQRNRKQMTQGQEKNQSIDFDTQTTWMLELLKQHGERSIVNMFKSLQEVINILNEEEFQETYGNFKKEHVSYKKETMYILK